MKKMISIICPTHRRATLQKRLAASVHDNAYRPSLSEVVFGVDDDDEIAIQTAKELQQQYGDEFIKICLVEPNKKLAEIVNLCAHTVATGQIICSAADDVVFRSKSWDLTVIKEFQKFDDKIMLLWSDDGLWGGALAAHYFMHRNWVKTVGDVQPTHFYADWTDHWNMRLAQQLGRARVITNREELFLEHMHAEHDGMEKDETYWKVKARREKNVIEGRHFDFNNPPPHLKELHDIEYHKLAAFIENYAEAEKSE